MKQEALILMQSNDFGWIRLMERMGFESDGNVVRRTNFGTRTSVTLGCQDYTFASAQEARWAQYLQLLLDNGKIASWQYEPVQWDFRGFGYRNKPYVYTPDFLVVDGSGEIYHEFKGYLETKDMSRMLRAARHYDARFDLVMQRLPRKGKASQIIAQAYGKKYIRRIVDASVIFRQIRGLVPLR
jgi:hypothetical protein